MNLQVIKLIPGLFRSIVVGLFSIFCLSLEGQEIFTNGVNLTSWFQTSGPRQIQFSKFSKKDFEQIKSLGCDVVRLPINLHAMTSGAPDYTLDPLFLSFLDQVVDWSEELQMHLIMDNHTFDPALATDPNVGQILVKVWKQMATHYADRSEYIYYEVLNEPHGIDDALWGSIQQSVIDEIRLVDDTHYIIVGPANWNNYNNLRFLPVYSDTKLIYTFHFYDPFIFTHQGASWTDPPMTDLGGVPFPYRSQDMPPVPPSLAGTWIQGNLQNYSSEGTVARVKSLIDIATTFRNQRGVPLFCGEFGVYDVRSNNNDRVQWYKEVRQYFQQKDIAWTIWDYTGGFGLFEVGGNDLFDYDLNVPLLEALSFNVPPQQHFIMRPQTKGLLIYDDYIGSGIVDSSVPGEGTLDYYSTDTPEMGEYCLYWTDVARYNSVALDFKPNVDLSLLKENEHVLKFQVRGNTPGVMFDIRFVDSKTGPADHPWRMGMTMNETVAPWDNEWHLVSVPLAALEERGSYDNGFFPPENKFDWKAIDRLEIVAEHQGLAGVKFWFDDIRIDGEEVPYEEPVTAVEDMVGRDLIVYPNPSRESLGLRFSLPTTAHVQINILTATGQRVGNLVNASLAEGAHEMYFDGDVITQLAAGIYLLEYKSSNHLLMKKWMKCK